MSTKVSRRSVLAAGVAVVGWSVANSTWATAADAGQRGVAKMPPLDGTLETAGPAIDGFGRDFGRLVTGKPMAVLRPGSVDDIVTVVTFARQHGIPVAMNGQGGSGGEFESHSNYGQALTPGGVAIDARSLSTIHRVDADSAYVDAGVTWADLTDAALAHGLTPAALTDYIRLSVGGTISIGGIGGTVQKYGLQCDTVREIEIVTGDGRLRTASPTVHSELFNAALAGAGQVGIIVRARISLVPAPARALVARLHYDDLTTFLGDQEKVLADGRFSDQTGEVVRRQDDSGWGYVMQVGSYYTPPDQPDQEALLSDLRDNRAEAEITDRTYREWAFRADGWEAYLKENGYWDQPKPWLSLIAPADQVKAIVEPIIAELTPGDVGGGAVFLYPFHRAKLTRPLFAVPESAEVLYLVDLLRFPEPGSPNIGQLLRQNRTTYDDAVALGAKRYLVGAIPDMTRADWERHFGRFWKSLVAAKRVYDPAGILTPGQGFFDQ